ncbi:AMP-dependent synthetase [Alteromonas aestuariivivens]|uniref:AMP-dependent synthetase n=1 Tax=Alteromonas aestuariivivens TaxID=1938339 RepID=A0A3D8MBH0_9ALTE|nr:AMP-binding protein [Alteromonas aestuariivivens]RDV26762.1 AMP-dependent synthetase [Alteromonas aestuariivivens]
MIGKIANWPGERTALEFRNGRLTYAELVEAVELRAAWLRAQKVSRVALMMDNTPEWVLFDLACQQAGVCCVPVPGFFSATQLCHLFEQAGIELLLKDSAAAELPAAEVVCLFDGIYAFRFSPLWEPLIPHGCEKITFTSGSTGAPKGVCLSTASQWQVAESLVKQVGLEQVRHLCLLPLPTLLENIAGVYAPLLAGGTVVLASEEMRGFAGSRLVKPESLLKLLVDTHPHTLILVPELLNILLTAAQSGWQPPTSLKFIAVGGAHVASELLERAQALNLPVYQGYGLSECVSVTALNLPTNVQPSSAGVPLNHNILAIENGEVVVQGNLFLGYLNEPDSFYPTKVKTGDLGSFAGDFLHIDGRRKNLLINSFGRNISPEWIEAELMASGFFLQVMVAGDAMPHCVALLVPMSDSLSEQHIQQAVMQVNQRLPDYAQICNWLQVAPFSAQQGQLTQNGKLKRAAILARYQNDLNALYRLQA